MQNSISLDSLATIIYVIVDDWYQSSGKRWVQGKPGRKPKLSNSELITLIILMDFLPFPGENQFLGFMRANFSHLFPKWIGQSQFNRRTRKLSPLIEQFRQQMATELDVNLSNGFLLDTKPIPVVGYKRSKKRSHFRDTADYGVCSSRNMKYFGYKLVMLSTMGGIPVNYELVAANTDERIAADEVLENVFNSDIYGDKGFIGEEWQANHRNANGNRIWTPKRTNQLIQNPKEFDRWLNSVRERIEGTFNELQNTGRNLERLLRKTVSGITAHVIAKMTSHTMKLLLRQEFGVDVQTFTISGA